MLILPPDTLFASIQEVEKEEVNVKLYMLGCRRFINLDSHLMYFFEFLSPLQSSSLFTLEMLHNSKYYTKNLQRCQRCPKDWHLVKRMASMTSESATTGVSLIFQAGVTLQKVGGTKYIQQVVWDPLRSPVGPGQCPGSSWMLAFLRFKF